MSSAHLVAPVCDGPLVQTIHCQLTSRSIALKTFPYHSAGEYVAIITAVSTHTRLTSRFSLPRLVSASVSGSPVVFQEDTSIQQSRYL